MLREEPLGNLDSARVLCEASTVASKAAGGLHSGELVDEAWGHINEEVASHFLDRYRDLLRG